MTRQAPVVEALGLSRRFGRRWAFARVDLELAAGDRLLIVGANGSGKTTLLRVLGTVLRPSLGQLRLFGEDVGQAATSVRGRVAMLSHHLGLYEDLSARDNIAVVARLGGHGLPDTASLLDAVGLEDRRDPVRTYSAGMRKRLQVATLLLQRPELVLLDEPFAALDPAGVDEVAQLLRGLGATLVVTSHRIALAARLCEQALLLDNGLPRWSGAAADAVHAWDALQTSGEGQSP